MSSVHAGPFMPYELGFCSYRFHAFGVYLSCGDRAIPGVDECADHFIAAAHERERTEATGGETA